MRAFFGVFGTETNTFSSLPCPLEAFLPLVGTAPGEPLYEAIVEPLVRRGYEVVGSFNAFAYPAGPSSKATYERLRDELLAEIASFASSLDAVVLFLHGAMVAQGYDDCEGDVLERVRDIVGPDVVVGAELDLHCHLSSAMTRNADAIVIYKEYPHVDVGARGAELCDIVARTAAGEIRPVMAVFDCRMIDMFYTSRPETRAFFESLRDAEFGNVLSVSIAHGFPWGDVPEVGTKMLVVADRDAALAEEVAEKFGRRLIDMRGTGREPWLDVDSALAVATTSDGLTILADATDNTGGGAPGDSTFLLRALVEADAIDAVVAAIYDPRAVEVAFAAGVGAWISVEIGGKLDPASGTPLVVDAEVLDLVPHFIDTGMGGVAFAFGDVAALRIGMVKVILQSERAQITNRGVFDALGIVIENHRVVVVKSMHHFHAAFGPLARRVIYVDAPGALPLDFARIPYRHALRPLWPLDTHPLAVPPAGRSR